MITHCGECKQKLEYSFRSHPGSDGIYRCLVCQTRRNLNKGAVDRRHRTLRQSGTSKVEYDRKYLEQQGCCKICKKFKSTLNADHNHLTGKARDLLCASCNRGIGLLLDSSDLCLEAAKYLIQHGC